MAGPIFCRNLLANFLNTFTRRGFNDWKVAIVSFNNHEKSDVHKFAVQMVVEIPQSVRNTGESMRVGLAAEKQENRAMLRIILQNSKYHIHFLVTAMIQKVIFNSY